MSLHFSRKPVTSCGCWSHVSTQEALDNAEAQIMLQAESLWTQPFKNVTVEERFQGSVVRTRLVTILWLSFILGTTDTVTGIRGLLEHSGDFPSTWALPPHYWLANGILWLVLGSVISKRKEKLMTNYLGTYRIALFYCIVCAASYTLFNLMCEFWMENRESGGFHSSLLRRTCAVLGILLCVPIMMGFLVVSANVIACSEAILFISAMAFIKPEDIFVASYLIGAVLCVMIVAISLIQRARQSFARAMVLQMVSQREIETLKQRTIEREAADQMQTQAQAYATVVASTVHDLKTPLAALHSGCSVLAHSGSQDCTGGISDFSAKEVLAHMRSATRMALGLVDGMSTSASLLRGEEIKPQYKMVNVKELIQSAMTCAQLAASHNAVEYRINIEDKITDVLTDAVAVSRNIVNLLINASRHTQEGSIVASAAIITSQDGTTQVEFSVADTGCGGVSQLAHIWEPFVSLAGSSGMGLYVVRKQAEALGGTAGVRENSAQGCGSVFWFQVPCTQAASFPKNVTAQPRQLQDVLLIDDVPYVIELLSMDLQRQGFRVETAQGPKQGLEKMKQSSFGVVLCDYNMPEENGAQCTAKLREWEEETGRSPQLILALTGENVEEVSEECLTAGMQAVLTKPMNIEEVTNAYLVYHKRSTQLCSAAAL